MDKWRRVLALVGSVVFILLGIGETVRAIRSGDGGLPFWFGSLCVGGVLILLGTFALSRKVWLSFGLTAIGSVTAPTHFLARSPNSGKRAIRSELIMGQPPRA